MRSGNSERKQISSIIGAIIFQVSAQVFFLTALVEAVRLQRTDAWLGFLLFFIDLLSIAAFTVYLSFSAKQADLGLRLRMLRNQQALRKKHLQEMVLFENTLERMRQSMLQDIDTLNHTLQRSEPPAASALPPSAPTALSSRAAIGCLLLEKQTAAQRTGIRFLCPSPLTLESLEDYEACILLGNLIDNALRGASNSGPNGWISLSETHFGGLTTLTCANSYDPQAAVEEPYRAGHGLGLSIVEDVVLAHEGECLFFPKTDTFSAVISLT